VRNRKCNIVIHGDFLLRGLRSPHTTLVDIEYHFAHNFQCTLQMITCRESTNSSSRHGNDSQISSCQQGYNYSFNFSWNHFSATFTASSMFSGFVPCPVLVGSFPPERPPTTSDTAVAHCSADTPCFACSYFMLAYDIRTHIIGPLLTVPT
jgi:hypothetical protein